MAANFFERHSGASDLLVKSLTNVNGELELVAVNSQNKPRLLTTSRKTSTLYTRSPLNELSCASVSYLPHLSKILAGRIVGGLEARQLLPGCSV